MQESKGLTISTDRTQFRMKSLSVIIKLIYKILKTMNIEIRLGVGKKTSKRKVDKLIFQFDSALLSFYDS
jgi:hypothetical protein